MKYMAISLVLACLLAAAVVAYCNIRIITYAAPRLYDDAAAVPHYRCALLLGTTPTVKSGNANKYFVYRIDACAALYKAGKIDRIIVSGDNRTSDYNEPEAMRRALVSRGIPSQAIFLDYAGFRTLDSVVRAKEIFGQSSFIVISQRFHNERAIFLASRHGIDAAGFNARDARLRYGFKTRLRETFARVKVFADLLVGKKPHFLGEKINID